VIRLVEGRCTGCGLCIATCPEHALRPARRQPTLLVASCTGCLACIEVCPVDVFATGLSRSAVPATEGVP
jgi:ferredoxin